MVDFKQFITIDSGKRFGKPIIQNTRISVYDVLNWLANGMTTADILHDFPELSEEAVKACLAYVAARESRLRAHGRYETVA